jgi:hypothetical protein
VVGEPLKGESKRLDTTLGLEMNAVVSLKKSPNQQVFCLRKAGSCLGSSIDWIKEESPRDAVIDHHRARVPNSVPNVATASETGSLLCTRSVTVGTSLSLVLV